MIPKDKSYNEIQMKRAKLFTLLFIILALSIVFFKFFEPSKVWVLNPKGWIGDQQRDLMITATVLMMIVVVPVFVLTFYIVFKYNENNKKSKYKPEWDSNIFIELVWWGIPVALISILSVMTWKSSHALDPFRPLDSSVKPLNVQVVALNWKWLFIYPDQNIASVNELYIPVGTPVNFQITSDAPMNSFWIPQLGGQIYAMTGMSTALHLVADEPGSYYGMSSNISGSGFAGMNFMTQATDREKFDKWVASAKQQYLYLDKAQYAQLSKPSRDVEPYVYSYVKNNLYQEIIDKYMEPGTIEHGHGNNRRNEEHQVE